MIESLREKWLRSGVKAGDTILIHSDIRRTLREARRFGLNIQPIDVLNSFLEAVGPKGTLLLPLFNFDFATGKDFNIRTSPSKMGALTEAGRLHGDAVRTGHPIYSFAAIGFKSGEFKGIDNQSGYAQDSPFGVLRSLNGKIAALDLDDQSCMTFYHHIEEVMNVDYRYYKTFKGNYYDWNGICDQRAYQIFVRNVSLGVKTDVNPAGTLLWQEGLYKGFRPKVDTGLRVISAVEMFKYIEQIIVNDGALGTLYSLE
jgi:aminoglycoside 3-N-acetyltransferase